PTTTIPATSAMPWPVSNTDRRRTTARRRPPTSACSLQSEAGMLLRRASLLSSLFFVMSCSGPSFTPAALPPLAAVDTTKPQPLHVPKLLLEPGEHFSFNVRVHGVAIGTADLDVSEAQAASKFKTNDVAGAFATVQDVSVTTLDRVGARAAASSETLLVDGETKTFGSGKGGQTVHSALGVIRA